MTGGVTAWRWRRIATTAAELCLGLAFIGVAAVMLARARESDYAEAAQHADNVASALQRDIERQVEIIELSLRNAAHGVQLVDRQQLNDDLRRAVLFGGSRVPQDYGTLLTLDEHAVATFDSDSVVPRQAESARRDYFQFHRDNPQLGPRLDLLAQGMLTHQPLLAFSERIDKPDGSFGGVAVAGLRMSMFADLFGGLQLGLEDDVLLMTTGGQAVYSRRDGTRFFARVVESGADLFPDVLEGTRAGVLNSASSLDGVERLYVYRRIRNADLVIRVGLALDGVYAASRQEAWIIGSMLGCLMLLAGLLAFSLQRELYLRERAEQAVRASEADYRLLAENSRDLVCRVGPDGRRRYASPAAARLLGVPIESLLRTSWRRFVHPDDRAAVERVARQMLTAPTETSDITFRIRRGDGAERWIEAFARPLRDEVTGEPDGYVSAWRDITDRKCAEVLLAESESRYRALAEHATDMITCLDVNLRRTYVSPASLAILGFAPNEMLGVRPVATIHPDDASMAEASFRRVVSGEVEQSLLTNRLRHKDGHYVWVEAKLALLRDPATGQPASVLCLVRDISERKAAADELLAANWELERLSQRLVHSRDAAEQASRAKSRFLASVSHELRTPLNGILGYAELLRLDGGLSDAQARRVEAMLAAGQHLLEMINSVLDFSEIESGRFDLRPVPTGLDELAMACLDVVRLAAEKKALQLVLCRSADAPPSVMVDPVRLRQILLNLLGNAVKFAERGPIELRIRSAGAAGVQIEVADRGPGIPADKRARLFQDFDRLGVEKVRTVEGAGLGLALSSRLAAAMSGTLCYSENPEGGSVFRLEIPVARSVPTEDAALEPGVEAPAAPGAPLRVLVVDDVAINRDITAAFLAAAGHEATCVEGGEEAVAAALAATYDVILMDVRMPHVSGLEATRRIRASGGRAARTPILAVTAQAFADEIAECLSGGMDEHLTKPFSQPALLAAMERAIAKHRRASAKDVVQAPNHSVPVA